MREVTVRFVTDPVDSSFRVEVDWTPKSGIETEDAYVDNIFRPCMDLLIKTVLPGEMGYGEGSSMEEARMKAFIGRDIGRASRSGNEKGEE